MKSRAEAASESCEHRSYENAQGRVRAIVGSSIVYSPPDNEHDGGKVARTRQHTPPVRQAAHFDSLLVVQAILELSNAFGNGLLVPSVLKAPLAHIRTSANRITERR